MDAVKLLKQDHAQVKALFQEYEEASERAHKKRQTIAQQAFQELAVHTTIEQEIFYPAVAAKGKELRELVDEGVQEHHVVDVLMQEMRRLAPDNPEYDAKFKVLMESAQHHIEEEEQELFPQAQERLRGELDQLGTQMEERKQQLMAGAR